MLESAPVEELCKLLGAVVNIVWKREQQNHKTTEQQLYLCVENVCSDFEKQHLRWVLIYFIHSKGTCWFVTQMSESAMVEELCKLLGAVVNIVAKREHHSFLCVENVHKKQHLREVSIYSF